MNWKAGCLFSRIIVIFKNPPNVQSDAFSQFTPAITIECGQSGNQDGIEKAFQLVLDVLHLQSLSVKTFFNTDDIRIYRSLGRVVIPKEVQFDFGEGSADILFPNQLEKYNFTELKKGTVFARLQTSPKKSLLKVLDQHDTDLSSRFFKIEDSQIVLCETVIPSMLTINKKAVMDDCLGYFMTPMEYSEI